MSSPSTPTKRRPRDYGPPGSGRNRKRTGSRVPPNAPRGMGYSSHTRTATNESGDLAKLVSGSDPLPHEIRPQNRALPPKFDLSAAMNSGNSMGINCSRADLNKPNLSAEEAHGASGVAVAGSSQDDAVVLSSSSDCEDSLAAQDPHSILRFLDDHSDTSCPNDLPSSRQSFSSQFLQLEDSPADFGRFQGQPPITSKETRPSQITFGTMDNKSSQKKGQSSGRKPHDQHEKVRWSSSAIKPGGASSGVFPSKEPATLDSPLEGFNVHRKQRGTSHAQGIHRASDPAPKNNIPSGPWTRRAAPPSSLESARGPASTQYVSSRSGGGVSIASNRGRGHFSSQIPSRNKNPWNGMARSIRTPSSPSPESEADAHSGRSTDDSAHRAAQEPGSAKNGEFSESNITVNDFSAANQEIGRLKSALHDSIKRAEKAEQDRDDLHNVLVAHKAAVENLNTKIREAETGKRLLEQQLRDRPLLSHPYVGAHQPMYGPLNAQSGALLLSPAAFSGISTPSTAYFSPGGQDGGMARPPAQLHRESSSGISSAQTSHSSGALVSPTLLTLQYGDDDYRPVFIKLFTSIQVFAKTNASTADNQRSDNLPHRLLQYLGDIADQGTVKALLGRVDTRWALIARIISSFLVEHILHPYVLVGFSGHSDAKLQCIAAEMQKSPGRQMKKHLLDEIAGLMRLITPLPDFVNYMNDKLQKHSNDLQGLIVPLLAPDVKDEVVRRVCTQLLNDAYTVTRATFSQPIEWIFKFPYAGDRFSSHGMENADPDFTDPVAELNRRHLRVKLGITPSLIKRNDVGPSLLVHAITKAAVLLMS